MGLKKIFCDPQKYNIIVSGESILSDENSETSLGGQGSAPNPTGELTALLQTSSVGKNHDLKKSVFLISIGCFLFKSDFFI